MPSIQKKQIFVRTTDSSTVQNLQSILTSWFELRHVKDVREADNCMKTGGAPHAVIVEIGAESPLKAIAGKPSRPEGLVFLDAMRERRPEARRVVVTDDADLSLIVHGLHTGTIDSLLYHPLTPAEVLVAVQAVPRRAPTAPVATQASA